MGLSSVVAAYIRSNRAECSDGEIRQALKEQGFSDEDIADAFHAAGPAPAKPFPYLRFLVPVLYAFSALLLLGALSLLFWSPGTP